MNSKEYLDSGKLELYVYGLLSEDENQEIAQLAKQNKEINDEIISIENAMVSLSSSFSPFLSADNYEKTKLKLDLEPSKVIPLKSKINRYNYIGWAAAAAILLIGIGYQYNQQITIENEIVTLENEKSKLNEVIFATQNESEQSKSIINVLRDTNNQVITLAGQTVSPTSSAKVYWNKNTQTVYIDASQLPEPPEGMVYQVWSLKLKPSLTPTSIGLLDNFKGNDSRIFKVEKTSDAEAFGITLEPAGGSKTPTMEQLYTLGTV